MEKILQKTKQWQSRVLSLLRIVTALLFMQHGAFQIIFRSGN